MTQIPDYAPRRFPEQSSGSGMAVASMVLGIISLALFCVWYFSIPCAIVGIVLGAVSIGKAKRGEASGAGMAKAGIVCSIVALAIDAIVIILVIVGISVFGPKLQQLQQQQLQQMKQMQQQQQVQPQSPATMPGGN